VPERIPVLVGQSGIENPVNPSPFTDLIVDIQELE